MTDYDVTFRFYDYDTMQLLDSLSIEVTSFPLAPGQFTLTEFEPGGLRRFALDIDDHVWMTIQFTRVLGIPLNDLGQLVGGPPNTGDSSRFIRNFMTGDLIDLGDSPEANLGMFVKTVAVPEPGCAVVLLSPLVAGRRRR